MAFNFQAFPAVSPPFLFVCIHSYDDYDYGSVNVLLERSLKVFVKTMACHPEQTSARIYHTFWRHFRHSEKVRTTSNMLPIAACPVTNHLTFSHVFSVVPSLQRMNQLAFQHVLSFPFSLNVIREGIVTDRT